MLFSHGWVDIVTLCATICLLAVFAVAAVAKLRDMQRARDELVQFGVPERWSRALLGTLVAVELLLAVLLAFPTTRAAGAWGALIALTMFSAAIVRQLLRGRRPACACFGGLSRSPIGWQSIARNLILLALAGVVAVFPAGIAAAAPLAMLPLPTLLLLLWAAAGTTWLLLLTRQNGRLLLRIEQLEQGRPAAGAAGTSAANSGPLQPGSPVPPLGLSDARGRPFELSGLRGSPVLLLFLDSACSHCRPLLVDLQQRRPIDIALVVVSESAVLQHKLPGELTLLVDPGRTSAGLFGVRGTPAAVLVDAGGAVAQTAVHGTSPVRAMLEQHSIEEVRHEWAPV